MGTKTLVDIHRDLKLLITSISGFEEGEEGFQLCERFALSQIKHHRYLSVNSHAVKDEIEKLTQKFLIHGKYDVAKEFQELVNTFLTSFDYERHPQYDIQWSLLSFLLNLATETNKSESSTKDQSQNVTYSAEENDSEEIDWAQYLKEGKEEFFNNYKSDSSSESEWSDEDKTSKLELSISKQSKEPFHEVDASAPALNQLKKSSDKTFTTLPQEILSKNWLKTNIQHSWWNELDWHQSKVDSQFETAHFYEIWRKNTLKSNKIIGTLSEYQVCRELLWMFHGLSSMALFQEENVNEYSIRDASIPSLTSVSFKSILLSFCEYFKVFKEFEIFLSTLFQFDSSISSEKPPLTYEAYGTALQKELLIIKKKFVEFEIELMKQEKHNTLLTLSKDFKKYLDKLKTLYEIHMKIIKDWKRSSNWQCSSTLITNLYMKIQNSSSYKTINLCASFYLASISVYLNIVDIWLSEGRFEDWRDEFIIYKPTDSTETSVAREEKSLEGFLVRELSIECLEDPIIKILLEKVLQMGRSIELLVKLDRVSDLWDIMDEEKVTKKTLNEEFFKEILFECSKYSSCSFPDYTDAVSLNVNDLSVSHCLDTDVELNVFQQVAATNNPFLINALEFFVSKLKSDEIDGKSSGLKEPKNFLNNNNHCFEFLDKSEVVLPWTKIFETAVIRVLELKFSKASKLVKDILMREYKLEDQLKLMRSVYMMETSHVMNKFCQLVFTEIESNGLWNNSYFVTCLLEEVLSQEWPDWSSRWSISVTNTRSKKVLEAVNNIKLHYAAGWPINMLLNEEALDKYNKIFRFELKLKWALWTLNTLRFSDLEGSGDLVVTDKIQHFHVRRLESMRFWLMHAVGSIHAYLSGQVLQSLGCALESTLVLAENLEAIVTIHNEYLTNVHEHCLQDRKFDDLTGPIHELLKMCDEVRNRWKPESLPFIGKILDQLENDYVKYHTYLALGLHNAVQHQDADYRKSEIAHQLLQYIDQIRPRCVIEKLKNCDEEKEDNKYYLLAELLKLKMEEGKEEQQKVPQANYMP